ncbi:ABC transporter substrate-binding protein [Halosolutus gelatinilyticus]|uniref:ABC transporter substrate-binding protein n=1 Tax=Halosolutus gelatinilyticus TaxID=2931975 RepID=UPI001FF18BE5|nr:ABC transporter substrate-binding protein [Halosolutus gelatinilyticus]
MRPRSFWVLDDADEAVIDRVAAGLGRTPARVLAYLILRTERVDDPATSVHLQVGTRLNRTAIAEATTRLADRDLAARSALRKGDPGRPQTAWRPIADREPTIARTYETHAEALLDRACNCHGISETGSVASESEPFDAAADLSIALNWRPNALHAPIHAAIETDWYDEFGVGVDLDHCDGSRRALDRVASGAAELAVAGAATVVRAREAGEPIIPIALCYQRAMTVLYTVRDVFGEPLGSVDQLEGRRVGMPPATETRLLGRLFLSQTAFADEIDIVDTNGEERDHLRRRVADVVTGSFADPLELERDGLTVDVLRLADHFPFYGPTIVVREATLADRPARIRDFLAGTTAGWAEARCDPRPAAERIAARSGDSPVMIERTFERAATRFGESDAVRERGWGWQRAEMWERLRTALDQADLLRDSASSNSNAGV